MKLDSTNWPTFKEKKPTSGAYIFIYQNNNYYDLKVSRDGKLVFYNCCCNEDRAFIPSEDARWIEQ